MLVFLLLVLCCQAQNAGLEVIVGQTALTEINTLVSEVLPHVLETVKVHKGGSSAHRKDSRYVWKSPHQNPWGLRLESLQRGNQTIFDRKDEHYDHGTRAFGNNPTYWDYQDECCVSLETSWYDSGPRLIFQGLIDYSDHGTVDIEIDRVGFLAAINIGEANARPTVHTPGVQFHLGN
jgi:hypothetical protein